MTRTPRLLPLLGFFLFVAAAPSATRAQHAGEALGAVSFPIQCQPAVRPAFERAVALLHSFGYDVAREGFEAVAMDDPSCAMARWGVAMSWYHPLWAAPTPAELASGKAAAESARAIGGADARERAWIAAIGGFYADSDKADHKTRAARFRDAMGELSRAYPQDDEAAIFHALAILGSAPPTDPTRAQQRAAANSLLEKVPRLPRHPGLTHYIIHAVDYPELAGQGLDAARRYARIAPSSPHALHMPSHIFVRLGLWPETIASNVDSEASAKAMEKRFPAASAFDALHALDYEVYAELQGRQIAAARDAFQRAAELASRLGDSEATFASAYASAAIPARLALEQSDWRAAAALPLSLTKGGLNRSIDERFAYVPAITWFSRALGAARSGDIALANEALAELASRQARLASSPPPGPYNWAGHVESQRLAASGWIERARGHNEEAMRLLREAAELEERVGKHPVTPGSVLPARELLGDLYLELARPREALAEYEASLQQAPNRLRSLEGGARAADLAGEAERARTFRNLVAAMTASGDGTVAASGAAGL